MFTNFWTTRIRRTGFTTRDFSFVRSVCFSSAREIGCVSSEAFGEKLFFGHPPASDHLAQSSRVVQPRPKCVWVERAICWIRKKTTKLRFTFAGKSDETARARKRYLMFRRTSVQINSQEIYRHSYYSIYAIRPQHLHNTNFQVYICIYMYVYACTCF